ncbi:MAG: TonB-dependent receptor [Acidobacteria bacterium]|nr:TonB-dependent receptor [Acidobacteriota bacterium]
MRVMRRVRWHHPLLVAALLAASSALAAAQVPLGAIEGAISTQHTTPLGGASVFVIDATGRIVATVVSDGDGRFRVGGLVTGTYRVMAVLEGFETVLESAVVSDRDPAHVMVDLPIGTLSDTIDVVGTTTAVSSGNTLATVEAIASRELDQFVPGAGFQGAVRMLSTAITLPNGSVSIKGGRPNQSGVQLGAASVVDPASAIAQVALPDDAIDSVTVLPNPYAVEYGRFASGLVVIQTRRAKDQWKFRINRFGPTFRNRRDQPFSFTHIDAWGPRFATGGPVIEDKLFVEQTGQFRYSRGEVPSRPPDEERVSTSMSSFTRVDANVSRRHMLGATVGVFPSQSTFATLGTFIPPDASIDFHTFATQAAVTERAMWTGKTVSETTIQFFQSRTDVVPQGTAPMELQPDTTLGNFFNSQHRNSTAYQLVSVVTTDRDGLGGVHLFKVGLDVIRLEYDGTSESRSVVIDRGDGTTARRIDFDAATSQSVGSTEAAVFAQDRLQLRPRWYVEAGGRLDRDGILGRVNVSPRLGTAVLLSESGSSVLRGGWGLFYERTPAVAGAFETFERETDRRFAADGRTPLGPAVRVARIAAPNLETPRSRTWDVGYEYRLNARWAFRAAYLQREGRQELIVTPSATPTGAALTLSSGGASSYRDGEVGVHFTRGASADVDVSYVRSSAQGDLNALTNFFDTVLAPVIGANAYGPLNADVPHRLFVRGRLMPAPRWLLLGVFDWRTGVPYSTVNEMLDFVEPRNAQRFPDAARLELGLERRIKVLRFQPWIGIRVTNILGAFLPADVQSNTSAPSYGTFYNSDNRGVRLQFRFER